MSVLVVLDPVPMSGSGCTPYWFSDVKDSGAWFNIQSTLPMLFDDCLFNDSHTQTPRFTHAFFIFGFLLDAFRLK
jgi:hypothetical protein